MRTKLYILVILSFYVSFVLGQNKWLHAYYNNKDAYGYHFSSSYDQGIYLLGKHGHNYVSFNWLIKTDINGNLLWEKTIGEPNSYLGLFSIDINDKGSTYIVGKTSFYDSHGDPIILKLDPCGEKEWCKVYYSPSHFDYASYVIALNEGGCVTTLRYTGISPDDRICLAKFSEYGDMLWKECYNSTDTGLVFEDSRSITLTPDKGYLISAVCDYENPNMPGQYLSKPYYIKTDSNGIFQWEQVIFKNEAEFGGNAWHTVLNPDTNCYYSCISRYYYQESRSAPALVKLSLNGDILGIYDIIDGFNHGGLANAEFLNDTILAASAGWGDTEEEIINYAILIDTLGNLIDTTFLFQDIYSSLLKLTFDKKLLYMYNTFKNNQFDVYLRKLNQQLEDDSIYTYPFKYDSLCPYPIASDTIVQDDCGLIVGTTEWPAINTTSKTTDALEVFPNPAYGEIHCKYRILERSGNPDLSGQNTELTISLYDIWG
ncbi:MAG: hypothetical protein KKA81_00690, partial [Bacteroidetes bacterium]|nr:hypothetical protein [Bacteroidota bacterium]